MYFELAVSLVDKGLASLTRHSPIWSIGQWENKNLVEVIETSGNLNNNYGL